MKRGVIFILGWVFFSAWLFAPIFYREQIGLNKLPLWAELSIYLVYLVIGAILYNGWKKYLRTTS